MFYLTPVVKNLLIINVLMYLATISIGAEWMYSTFGLFYPDEPNFMPLQLVTNMFMHAMDPSHLFFNMLGLFFLGRQLEQHWGPKRFLFTYLLAGIVGSLAHVGIRGIEIYAEFGTFTPFSQGLRGTYGVLVGASGSVFGILAAFGLLFPNFSLYLFFIPVGIPAKIFVPVYILISFYAFANPSADDSVAHFAHIGGAFAGMVMVWYWHVRKK